MDFIQGNNNDYPMFAKIVTTSEACRMDIGYLSSETGFSCVRKQTGSNFIFSSSGLLKFVSN